MKAASSLPEGSTVTGLVYDVASGRIEIVVPTTPLGDGGRTAQETRPRRHVLAPTRRHADTCRSSKPKKG
ncbi:MAG: hypothetical protein ACXWQ5_08900 [Ktedonobacterales bacterium]